MDQLNVNNLLPEDVKKKGYRLTDDIPGPVFTMVEKGVTKFDFDVYTLTVEKADELMKQKFPFLAKTSKAEKLAPTE